MENGLIEIEVLKCDNKDCGLETKIEKIVGVSKNLDVVAKYIGMKCPKCDSSLLEWEHILPLMKIETAMLQVQLFYFRHPRLFKFFDKLGLMKEKTFKIFWTKEGKKMNIKKMNIKEKKEKKE